MEAVPKLPLISFELKTSPENTHFAPKLKQYIAEAYREDPDSYTNEIHQLECLRSAAVRPTMDEEGLRGLIKYFCQLRSLQSRFPMAKGQPAACSFSWKDLYANMSCSLADIRFEMACILYNIGALHTFLGASEPRTTADSLKAACTHYQNAIWAFQYLKEQYPQPPGVDVSTEIMRFLQKVCFAQAQECILEKSIQDTRKPSVVGAVATQVLLFYKSALSALGPSSGTDNIHEIIGTKLYHYWSRYLLFKAAYIGSTVSLYQGMNAEEQQKMGERVAFYQLAINRLADARKLTKYIEPVQVSQEAITFIHDVIEGKRKAAKNENEFIYHEEVPGKDWHVEMKPVCLVSALPINFNDPEVSGPDVFARLVPICAHETSSLYSEEKAKILRQIVTQAESKNTELTEFMSSLQLDQLEVIDAEQKIPQEIVDRCAAMNAKSEIIQSLVDSMNSLAEIISDVEHSLSDVKTLIQEETIKEKEYQKTMGPRPPSIVQTELSREYHKYHEAHTRTHESNQVLHKAMTLHIANLKLLAQPLDELQAKIPSIDNIEGLDRETMGEMRRVVAKAREMQIQRDSLIQSLREDITNDDITSQLLARGTEPAQDIFKQAIEKHTPKVKLIELNLAAQENIINKLTSLYASYGESRRLLTDVLRKRDSLINALITSYDAYEELLTKSQRGIEFYKKLLHNVNQLLTRLKGTCQVHEEERCQLLAKNSKPSIPSPSVTPKPSDGTAPRAKLKDYLPYMKNRTARGIPSQAQTDQMPADAYYPESIYPTSIRPAPVGSEATELQMQLPDGVVMPQMQQPNPYDRYGYASTENDPYAQQKFAYAGKAFDKPDDNYGYSSPYTPQQFNNMADPSQQSYSNPYYSATHNSTTAVTDSQGGMHYQQNQSPAEFANNQSNNPQLAIKQPQNQNMTPTPHQYDQYSQGTLSSQATFIPDVSYSQADLNASFSQMQVSAPKPEQANFGGDYTQTYFSAQYPVATTPNYATYSHSVNTSSNMAPSQSSDYSSLNYPYSSASDSSHGQGYQGGNVQGNPQVPQGSHPQMANVQRNNPQMGFAQPSNPQTGNFHTNPASLAQPNPQTGHFQVDSHAYNTSDPQYISSSSYNMSQGYQVYTNAQSAVTSTTNITNQSINTVNQPIPEPGTPYMNPSLAHLDELDQPIKSHAKREALPSNLYQQGFQNYVQPVIQPAPSSSSDQGYQPANAYKYSDHSNVNYSQGYQNHPGYTYNSVSGGYDYNYGSQNAYSTTTYDANQGIQNHQSTEKNPNLPAHGAYTNAGAHGATVQSPSETPQGQFDQTGNNQIYYNTPYGYITNTNQAQEIVQDQTLPTNYGANVNQSTYMQSGQANNTSTTSTNYQVSPTENMPEPNFEQNSQSNVYNQSNGHTHGQNSDYKQNDHQDQSNTGQVQNPEPHQPENDHNTFQPPSVDQNSQPELEKPLEPIPESKEPSVFDLLSDIDFTVEHKPLMPEIKVPQISESAIKKPLSKPEPVKKPVVKEEVLERPAQNDLFSDPGLLNLLTQEVKKLQKFTDSLTNKAGSGLTVLDSKWKTFQDLQNKENMTRSKTVAMQHTHGNIVTEVVPYDDSRLTLKSDPDAYINASYYKQLASWCIPLVISKNPVEEEYTIFWKAVLENKICCIVCLLSEMEMQGKSYWPTAKGQSLDLSGLKVTLDDVNCTVHWTERKLTVTNGKTVLGVTHYQINVFPAKIVCSPLVLLVDKVLSLTYENQLGDQLGGAWIQCSVGAGRSAVFALLCMIMCQVRAGQLRLCDMLDEGCINLCKHRSNVLEDTKYLADAYRTALFYVQGVLCSGTTNFNGEAVSSASGASVLPPVTPTPANTLPKQKFSRESFEDMKQSPGLKSGDMRDPLNFLDPLWSLKKK